MRSTKSGQFNWIEQPPRRRICTSWIVPLLLLWMLPAGLGLMMVGRLTAQTLTTLYTFSDLGPDDSGALILSGNTLYGTTYGAVFALNTDGTGYTNLYTFTALSGFGLGAYTNSDGAFPHAGLILSGNTLYGTANRGGSSGNGTVFAVNTDGTGFTNLHSFTAFSGPYLWAGSNIDGGVPNGGLILSSNTLYGTANGGGSSGNGTVFAVNTDGTGFRTLHSFTALPGSAPWTNSDGVGPGGGLILSGNTLYGTANRGGSSGNGTVFAVNTDGTGFTVLYSFSAGSANSSNYTTNSDGADPCGSLMLSGNTLYGTAEGGGSSGNGTVFAVNTDGTGFTNLHSFTGGSDGASPDAGLILSGNTLYGTTIWGGSSTGFQGFGTVFSIDTNATDYFVLYSFTGGNNGTDPGSLIVTNNTVYGTTAYSDDGLGDYINPTLFSLAVPAGVEAQLLYMTNNGAVTISAYRGSGGVVIIPSIIAGLPVTTIGADAFYNCTSLTSVTIPNSVTNIGDNAFGGCTSLTGITVEALNSAYISVDGVLFDKSQTTLIQYPAGQTGTSYTIPNSVTSIGEQAFARCSSLTNVTIGNSVTSIETNAFSYCTSLVSVTIGNSVTTIGYEAFWGCANLTSVYFQGNAPSFGTNVFVDYFEQGPGGIAWLPIWDPAAIYYLPGTTGWSTNFAGLPAFLWDSSASMGYTTNNGTVTIIRYTGPGGDVTIPSTINGQPVASIGGYYDPNGNWFGAFQGCTSLASVTIPNSVTSIEGPAFSGCGSLTAITVDTRNPVYSDVDGVLFNRSLTTLLEYPAGIAGSYTIPNSVTNIGGYYDPYGNWFGAFQGCTNLTSVTIPNSVTSIGDSAFAWCSSLTAVIIPNSVTNIGADAFVYCTSLTSVTIPNGVTSIPYQAFGWCESLTSITIPNSVTSIGEQAFLYCTSLTSVYFQGNAPNADWTVFNSDNNVTVYYLPGTTGWSDFSANTGLPVVLWNPQVQTNDATFGVRTNRFGFNITGTSGLVIVVEACTNLANPVWSPVGTNTLTSGSAYFSDPQWTNYPARFYRLRWP